MNLQQTVSKILKREVTIDEAQTFAFEQYGVLTAYNREMDEKFKPKTELRFYVLDTQDISIDKGFEELTEDEWVLECERQGRIYTINGFQNAFNEEAINTIDDVLKILSVSI